MRTRADQDVREAVDYYLREAGERVALAFVDALERAFLHVASHPASGSTRHVHALDLPGLRSWPVKRYPYLLFYVDKDDHIDVWRVLHDQRDIPAWLREED
nr:type II toxin-antitoxin system RelE/ParE family toxin [Sedimenticola hydrogenitrophicus]